MLGTRPRHRLPLWQRLYAAPPMLLTDALADWIPLLPGIALWALALYLPLSLPLRVLEERLNGAGMGEELQGLLLVLISLGVALAAGVLMELLIGLALGPGWGSSLGLVAALWGLFTALASRNSKD